MQYQIEYQKNGDSFIFQTEAENKREAVEIFRQHEHFDVRIERIKELPETEKEEV